MSFYWQDPVERRAGHARASRGEQGEPLLGRLLPFANVGLGQGLCGVLGTLLLYYITYCSLVTTRT